MVLASLLRCLGAAPPAFGWPMGATKALFTAVARSQGDGTAYYATVSGYRPALPMPEHGEPERTVW